MWPFNRTRFRKSAQLQRGPAVRSRSRRASLMVEQLEDRQLLSGFLQGTVFEPGNLAPSKRLPLPGATVQLYGGSTLIGQRITDASGAYLFDNVPAGTYLLKELPPTGWVNFGTDVSASGPVNSVIGSNASTITVTIPSQLTVSLDNDAYITSGRYE